MFYLCNTKTCTQTLSQPCYFKSAQLKHTCSFSFPAEWLVVFLNSAPISVSQQHANIHVGRRLFFFFFLNQPHHRRNQWPTLAQIGSDLVQLLSLLGATHGTFWEMTSTSHTQPHWENTHTHTQLKINHLKKKELIIVVKSQRGSNQKGTLCRYSRIFMGGLGRIACKGPVTGGRKWGEEEQTRGGGLAAVIDCFVGTISVAQLDAWADGFNYFRLNLNGARGVWKKRAARLGVKGLCCHLPNPQTHAHTNTQYLILQ